MAHSRKETDFFGNEKEVHYDDSNNKIGETKFTETFWGSKIQEHFDAGGEKIGSTRREEGLFSDHAAHYDTEGNRIGTTKDDSTFLGDRFQRHFQTDGKQVGESHFEDTIFSGVRKVHEGEYFKGHSSTGSDSPSSAQGRPGLTGGRSGAFQGVAVGLILAVLVVVLSSTPNQPSTSRPAVSHRQVAAPPSPTGPAHSNTSSYFGESFSLSVSEAYSDGVETVVVVTLNNLTEKATRVLLGSGLSEFSLGQEMFVPRPFLRDEHGNEYLLSQPRSLGIAEAQIFDHRGWGGATTVKVALPSHAQVVGQLRFPKLLAGANSVTLVVPGIPGWQSDLTIPSITVQSRSSVVESEAASSDEDLNLVRLARESGHKARVIIARSGVAEEVSSEGVVRGESDVFTGNAMYDKTSRESVAYFAEFSGAIPERTRFETRLLYNGIERPPYSGQTCASVTAKSRNGMFMCRTEGYFLASGRWAIRLIVDGQEAAMTEFDVVPGS